MQFVVKIFIVFKLNISKMSKNPMGLSTRHIFFLAVYECKDLANVLFLSALQMLKRVKSSHLCGIFSPYKYLCNWSLPSCGTLLTGFSCHLDCIFFLCSREYFKLWACLRKAQKVRYSTVFAVLSPVLV